MRHERAGTTLSGDDRKLDAFSPIRQRKVADEVVAVLVDAIRGGLYEPGEPLPRGRDLAARLEVSRATVREAIGVLERARIVSVRRGNTGGVTVETRSIPASVLAAIEGETHANVLTLLEARRALELLTARLAAERGSMEAFLELHGLVDKLEELRDQPDEATVIDLQFHLKIAEMSGNSILEEFTKATLHRLNAFRAKYPVGRASPNIDLGIVLQRETLEAIESREPGRIEAAVDDHVGNIEEYFLGERLEFVASE